MRKARQIIELNSALATTHLNIDNYDVLVNECTLANMTERQDASTSKIFNSGTWSEI